MRRFWLGFALLVLAAPPHALAQTPPAPEPTPPEPAPPTPPAPPPPAPAVPTPEPPAESTPTPESAPAAATEPPPAVPAPPSPAPQPPAREETPVDTKAKTAQPDREDAPPPFVRAHQALTLEGRLGLSWRPGGAGGFDDESGLGTELGLSLYMDVVREIALGLEVDYAGLGGGTTLSGLDSITADYGVTSAMFGFRAYPKRSELLDLFVGLQVGIGIQGVSASGTSSNGSLEPAVAYRCSGSDSPGFQLGGGAGARLMLAPRWGVTARINATGRRLTGELVEGCARGIGTTTTVSGSIGVGYDFDLAP